MRRTLIALVALFFLVQPACYRRVVATKGLGGTGQRVDPSYRSDTAADRAVDGMMGRQSGHMTQYDRQTYDEKR